MFDNLAKKLELVGLGIILLATFIVFVVPDFCGFERWPKHENLYTEPACIIRGAESMYTVRDYIAHGVSQGHMPQWLHAAGIGYPIALQYCWQIYNPLEWLWWNDSPWNRTIVLWLYLSLCGYVFFMTMRKIWSLDRYAALVPAFLYILSSWALWYYTYWYYMTILLPLVLMLYAALSILYRKKNIWNFTLLCLGLILFVLNGQPQVIFCSAISLGLLLLALIIFDWKRIQGLAKSLWLMVAASAVTILVTSWQTVAFVIDQLKEQTWSQHDVSLGVSYWVTAVANLFKLTSPYLRGFFYQNWFYNEKLGSVTWEDFAISFGVVGSFLILAGTVYLFGKLTIGYEDEQDGVNPVSQRVLTRCVAAIFYAVLFTVAWHAIVSRSYSYWPFEFINFSRYFVPTLTLFGAVIAGVGAQKLNLSRNKLNLILMVVVSLIPLFGFGLLYFTSTKPVESLVALHCAMLTFAPLIIFWLAMIGAYWLLKNKESVDIKHIHACLMLLVFADLFYIARYEHGFGNDAFRLIPYCIFVAAIAFFLLRKYKLFVVGFVLFLIVNVAILGFVHKNEPRVAKPAKTRYDLAAQFMRKVEADQAKTGYRPRVLPTYIRYQYIGFNAQYHVDQMSTFIPIVSRSWGGYLFDFLRPEMMQTHQLTILPNMFGGIWPVYESNKGGVYWKDFIEKKDYYRLLGVTHLMGLHDGPLGETMEKHPEFADMATLVYVTPPKYFQVNCYQIEIYALKDPLPRVFLANKFRMVPYTNDGWFARKTMKSDKSKLINEPVVEVPYDKAPKYATIVDVGSMEHKCLQKEDGQKAEIVPQKILKYSADEVVIESNSTACGLLVLNDAYHYNWVAYVDNQPTPIYRVNSLMRGVVIPPGKHQVIFRYEPVRGMITILPHVGIALYLLVSLLLFAGAFRSRRRRGHPDDVA